MYLHCRSCAAGLVMMMKIMMVMMMILVMTMIFIVIMMIIVMSGDDGYISYTNKWQTSLLGYFPINYYLGLGHIFKHFC